MISLFVVFPLSFVFIIFFVPQVVNPYKRYPIYTHRVCKIYLGRRRKL